MYPLLDLGPLLYSFRFRVPELRLIVSLEHYFTFFHYFSFKRNSTRKQSIKLLKGSSLINCRFIVKLQ